MNELGIGQAAKERFEVQQLLLRQAKRANTVILVGMSRTSVVIVL